MITMTVQPGETLSGIAAQEGTSLNSLEAANPQFSDPNVIYVGQNVNLPGVSTPATVTVKTPAPQQSTPQQSTGGGIDSIPGVPSSFVACVAYRESTNGTNAAYNGGVYGIITASGYNVNGQSLAAQKAAFQKIYATTGPSAWAADGCPGT